MKQCGKCRETYPRTTEHFYKKHDTKDGLYSICKLCKNKYKARNSKVSNSTYRSKNIEKYRAMERESHQRHKEKRNEYHRQWKRDNRDKVNLQEQRRRAKSKHLASSFTLNQWVQCKEFFHNSCAYCGDKESQLTQDHFIPVHLGGEYTLNNIVPSCGLCNSSKNDSCFWNWYSSKPYSTKSRENKIMKYLGYHSQSIQTLKLV